MSEIKKTTVDLLPERMREHEVRESIQKAAAHARRLAEQKGERVRTDEHYRKEMERCAERDRKDGKI